MTKVSSALCLRCEPAKDEFLGQGVRDATTRSDECIIEDKSRTPIGMRMVKVRERTRCKISAYARIVELPATVVPLRDKGLDRACRTRDFVVPTESLSESLGFLHAIRRIRSLIDAGRKACCSKAGNICGSAEGQLKCELLDQGTSLKEKNPEPSPVTSWHSSLGAPTAISRPSPSQ